jgi:hypothetical protein
VRKGTECVRANPANIGTHEPAAIFSESLNLHREESWLPRARSRFVTIRVLRRSSFWLTIKGAFIFWGDLGACRPHLTPSLASKHDDTCETGGGEGWQWGVLLCEDRFLSFYCDMVTIELSQKITRI